VRIGDWERRGAPLDHRLRIDAPSGFSSLVASRFHRPRRRRLLWPRAPQRGARVRHLEQA
jgi:hypothetical protein